VHISWLGSLTAVTLGGLCVAQTGSASALSQECVYNRKICAYGIGPMCCKQPGVVPAVCHLSFKSRHWQCFVLLPGDASVYVFHAMQAGDHASGNQPT